MHRCGGGAVHRLPANNSTIERRGPACVGPLPGRGVVRPGGPIGDRSTSCPSPATNLLVPLRVALDLEDFCFAFCSFASAHGVMLSFLRWWAVVFSPRRSFPPRFDEGELFVVSGPLDAPNQAAHNTNFFLWGHSLLVWIGGHLGAAILVHWRFLVSTSSSVAQVFAFSIVPHFQSALPSSFWFVNVAQCWVSEMLLHLNWRPVFLVSYSDLKASKFALLL